MYSQLICITFFCASKDHHESSKVTSIYFFDHMNNFLLSKAVGRPSLSGLVPKLFIHLWVERMALRSLTWVGPQVLFYERLSQTYMLLSGQKSCFCQWHELIWGKKSFQIWPMLCIKLFQGMTRKETSRWKEFLSRKFWQREMDQGRNKRYVYTLPVTSLVDQV